MGRHRAAIIGGGRIGCGFGWPRYPYIYTHIEAYLALKNRITVVAVVEPDEKRGTYAFKTFGVPWVRTVEELYPDVPDVVSVCVPPDKQGSVLNKINWGPAVFLEKPQCGAINPAWLKHVQVNFCRRFDALHQQVAKWVRGKNGTLTVWAKNDIHTVCHFEDLAKWWDAKLDYHDNLGEVPATNSYRIDVGKWAMEFRNGGITDLDFMVNALSNLLDAVDNGTPLLSPAYMETP